MRFVIIVLAAGLAACSQPQIGAYQQRTPSSLSLAPVSLYSRSAPRPYRTIRRIPAPKSDHQDNVVEVRAPEPEGPTEDELRVQRRLNDIQSELQRIEQRLK